MTLAIDTSVIIDIENRKSVTIEKLRELSEAHPAPASVAFISYYEFIFGLHVKSPKNKEKSIAFIEMFHFLEPTKKTADILSDLRHKYEKQGKKFSLSDLLIAAQVMENSMTLVTSDKKFREIEEIRKIII